MENFSRLVAVIHYATVTIIRLDRYGAPAGYALRDGVGVIGMNLRSIGSTVVPAYSFSYSVIVSGIHHSESFACNRLY